MSGIVKESILSTLNKVHKFCLMNFEKVPSVFSRGDININRFAVYIRKGYDACKIFYFLIGPEKRESI